VPLGGGAVRTRVSGLYMPEAIAADTSGVYWANYGDGAVMWLTADGIVTTLASGQIAPSSIALDDTDVFVAGYDGVSKVSKQGDAPTRVTAGNVLDLAVDESSVYWTDGSTVMKATPK
jgi:hypothetical protein